MIIETLKKHRKKLLFLMLTGAGSIILLVIGGVQLMEFTDSITFCGRLCHDVMYPEYTTYQESPHSNVPCADCHVGPGASYLVKSKISGIPMITSTVSGDYEKPVPVPVKNLRPARETCEKCHRPQKFAGDLVRTHTTYLTDEGNTEKLDTRVMRVGGGESGAAQDIHWHIDAEVWYLPLDEQRKDIAWIGIEGPDGEYTAEYINPQISSEKNATPPDGERRLMDCIDCHNRATHIFKSPEQIIDEAMVQGRIDASLPYIKREAARALYPPNPSLDIAYGKVEAIRDFYQNSYPQVFNDKQTEIDKAIEELKKVALLTTFPYMKVTWETYEDFSTHEGCFRCHGKLVASTGSEIGKTVDASCDSCHYLIN